MIAIRERRMADVVIRHWREGRNTFDIAGIVGMPEADVARIVANDLNRRLDQKRREREGQR